MCASVAFTLRSEIDVTAFRIHSYGHPYAHTCVGGTLTRNLKSLLSCDVEEKYQKLTPVDCLDSLRKPTLETEP